MDEKSLVDKLLETIPEFECSDYMDDDCKDLPYVIFGNFSLFIKSHIEGNDERRESILDRAFQLLNEMATIDDPYIESLLTVGVLEGFTDTEDVFEYAMGKLNENGRKYLTGAWKFLRKE